MTARRMPVGPMVAAECLDYALANGERFGVWGGLSERQRKGMRAARRQERIAS